MLLLSVGKRERGKQEQLLPFLFHQHSAIATIRFSFKAQEEKKLEQE